MKNILLSVTLLGSLFASPSTAANPATAWIEYRNEAATMTKDIRKHFPGRPDIEKNLDLIWTLLLKVEVEDFELGNAMSAEIEQKVTEGKMSPTTGFRLSQKMTQQLLVREEYLFGNLFRRVVSEYLADMEPGDRAEDILGKRVRIAITMDETNEVLKCHYFNPADYGLTTRTFKKIEESKE